MTQAYKKIIENWINLKDTVEWQIRGLALYLGLRRIVEETVLPRLIEVLEERYSIKVADDKIKPICGKILAFGIFVMTRDILNLYSETELADKFNVFVIKIFLNDFDEKKETLLEYEKANPVLKKGQVIWAPGKSVAEVFGKEDFWLAMESSIVCSRFMAEPQAIVTSFIMKAPIEKVKEFLINIYIEEGYYNKFKSLLW